MLKVVIWFASILSMFGIIFEFIRVKKYKSSSLLSSSLALPFYSAGILQWALHGITVKDPALYIPCIIQLFFLVPLLKTYIQDKLPA